MIIIVLIIPRLVSIPGCTKRRIRGWRAVSAARLHGKDSSKILVFSQTPVCQAAPNVLLPWTRHLCGCRARRGNSQRLARSSAQVLPQEQKLHVYRSGTFGAFKTYKNLGYCLIIKLSTDTHRSQSTIAHFSMIVIRESFKTCFGWEVQTSPRYVFAFWVVLPPLRVSHCCSLSLEARDVWELALALVSPRSMYFAMVLLNLC